MVLSLALVTGAVFAKQNHDDDDERPGWGFGDDNHEHTGPPGGPSVHPVHDDDDDEDEIELEDSDHESHEDSEDEDDD